MTCHLCCVVWVVCVNACAYLSIGRLEYTPPFIRMKSARFSFPTEEVEEKLVDQVSSLSCRLINVLYTLIRPPYHQYEKCFFGHIWWGIKKMIFDYKKCYTHAMMLTVCMHAFCAPKHTMVNAEGRRCI